MTDFKQQLIQMYTTKQEELTDKIEDFLGRVVESAAENGVDIRTISVNTEDLLDEEINYDAFVGFLNKNGIHPVTSGDYIMIDLGVK